MFSMPRSFDEQVQNITEDEDVRCLKTGASSISEEYANYYLRFSRRVLLKRCQGAHDVDSVHSHQHLPEGRLSAAVAVPCCV